MTEGEKPERGGEPSSQPGPGKEHFEKFKIGSSEEDIEKFRGPEWRSEIPDIRMQLGADAFRLTEEEYFLRTQQERAAFEVGYTPMFRAADLLKTAEKNEKERLREFLKERYLRASFFRASEIGNLLFEALHHNKEITFQADRFRGQTGSEASLTQAEHSVLDPEDKEKAALIKRVHGDLAWWTSAGNLADAAGVKAARYYDAWLMSNVLQTASGRRIALLTDEFQTLLTNNQEALNLTEEEVASLPDLGLGEEGKESIRERMVDYLSEQHFWKKAVHALGNYNPLEEQLERQLAMKLSETEKQFVRDIFRVDKSTVMVNGEEFPRSLLFFHTTVNTGHDLRRWQALTMSLLLNGMHKKILGLPDSPEGFTENDKELYEETRQKVLDDASDIQDRLGGLLSNDEKLAHLAVRMGIAFDYVTLATAEFGQYLKWKEKVEGRPETVYPELSVGPPNTASDAVNLLVWIYHELGYSKKARVRTPFIAPFDTEWTDFTREYGGGLGWIPNIVKDRLRGFVEANSRMKRGAALLGLWDLDKDRDVQSFLRKVRGNKQFNPKFREFLEEISFGIPTPYKDSNGRHLVMPMPFRTGFTSVNLLRNLISREGENKGKTVEDRLDEGALLKEIDFNDFPFYAHDEQDVNLSMGTRVLSMMYGMFDERGAAEYLPLEPGKEYPSTGHLIKRYDLFGRQEHVTFKVEREGKLVETKVPREFFEVVYTAYEVVAYLAFVKHGVWDAAGYRGLKAEAFWDDINRWIYAAESLPDKKGNFENYRDSVVLTARFLTECVLAIHEVASKAEKETVDAVRGASDIQRPTRTI